VGLELGVHQRLAVPIVYNQVLLLPAVLIVIYRNDGARNNLTRRVSLVLLQWSFFAAPIAVIAESIWPHSDIWLSLPFQNLLLPLGITITLLSQKAFAQLFTTAKLKYLKVSS